MAINFQLAECFLNSRCCVTKLHRWLDEIWFIFTCTSSSKSGKLFPRELLSYNLPLTLNVIQFVHHMLAHLPQMLVFHTSNTYDACVTDRKTTDDFQYSAGKNIKISSSHWWHFLTATSAIID